MSSRAKKKQKSRPQKPEPSQEPAPDAMSDWRYAKGVPLTENQKRRLELFSGAFLFFAAAGGGSYALLESWILSLLCGTIAMIVALVLVRRGDTLF